MVFWRPFYRRYKTLLKIVCLSFLISYGIIWLYEARQSNFHGGLRAARKRFNLQKRTPASLAEQNYAYASLLCDDVMSDATKVLIHSLKQRTNYPFILLVLPQVKHTEDFVKLGAKLQVISELEYPFKVNQEKVAINKMCRYSKLHIWKFIQYKKIIFIDVDCLIMQSLDKAFMWPEFSAVKDAGDTYNTGLFVLEPSLKTYDDMIRQYMDSPSYNQGDQGFLNWYFRNSVKMALPLKYNTVCKHKSHAVWPILKMTTKMIHYTSETKPWNFYASSHKFWRQNFDPYMFYLWNNAYRSVSEELRIDVFDPRTAMWMNSKRMPEVCDRFSAVYEQQRKAHVMDKISVVFIKWRSLDSLLEAIEHYRTVLEHIVAKVYVSWNPSNGVPPVELNRFKYLKGEDQVPVELIFHRFDTPNNHWNPIYGLPTRAVFFANDEHLPDAEKVEIALETWQNNPNTAVGFFARYHGKQKLIDFEVFDAIEEDVYSEPGSAPGFTAPSSSVISQPTSVVSQFAQTSIVDESWQWNYNLTSIRRPRPYSLLSSNLMMLNSDYLFIYTCLLPERIHRYIDEQPEDSSDLAMNLLIVGMTGNKPMLIKSDFSTDPESPKYDSSWGMLRASMLKDLVRLFNGGTKDPLQYNSLIIGQFNKIPFKKRSPKQWYNV